jgi:5-methyltetrahydrofolate--homocysteine methyltransferase
MPARPPASATARAPPALSSFVTGPLSRLTAPAPATKFLEVKPEELIQRLRRAPLLLDGGLGTLLMAAGLPAGRAPEHWTIERPAQIEAAHRAYVEAGSQLIHTVSFGASPPKLSAAGLDGRCREVNALAVRLARRAASGSAALVAGDLGPTTRFLPPLGDATVEELEAAFREQTEVLAGEGVDLFSIETMVDLREALAATRAALATGLPVLCSLTVDLKRRGAFTMMGDPLVPSLQALAAEGAHAVGCNCTLTSPDMLRVVEEAAPAVSTAIVAQPNAGQPRPTPDGVVYDADPEAMALDLQRMVQAGARLVGGCCGTGPELIRATARLLGAGEP